MDRERQQDVGRAGLTLETERLVMRPWTYDDVPRHFETYSRDEVTRWLSGESVTDAEQCKSWIDRWNAWDGKRFGVWAVVVRETGTIAGSVLLVPTPLSGRGDRPPPEEGGVVEVGWHLHPDSWGKGIATEAGRAALDHGFAGGLEEIIAVTNLDNYPSQAVCRRLGMEHRGRTEDYYDHELELFVALSGDRARR